MNRFNWMSEIGHPTAWIGHMDWSYETVAEVKPKLIVELGVHYGHSLFAMAQAIKDYDLNTKIVGIDSWQGDAHVGKYSDDVYNSVVNIKDKYFDNINLKLYKKNFDDARVLVKNNAVDILHIDGAHDYNSVRNDVDNYIKKIKPSGQLWMHDIDVKHFGVEKVYNEILTEHPEWKHEERHTSFGLGIITTNE